MAKDWIKMRMDLPSHPKVVRILSATKSDKFRVIGGLHAVWSVFDIHSEDGELVGYTPETMDHIIGWTGFCDAMMMVGWLEFDGKESLYMPDFNTHNGQSAKRRAEESERKRASRKRPQSVRNLSANEQDKMRSREEKRRVIDTPLPPNGELSESDCKTIIGLYHKWLPENPKATNLTDKRMRAIRKLWGVQVSIPVDGKTVEMKTDSFDFWERYFKRASNQGHLVGESESQWMANFDWLIQKSNFYKVIELAYEGKNE